MASTMTDMQSGSGGSDPATVASLRTTLTVARLAAVLAFVALAVVFGLKMEAYIQVPVGLVCYIAVEWQRRVARRLSALQSGRSVD